MNIAFARTLAEIARCHAVMAQLRTHVSEEDFLLRVEQQQQRFGYRLVYLEDAGAIQAVAGFRIGACLAWGTYLYVEDLVTDAGSRSKGYGEQLFDWIVTHAREQSCDQVHLDSGVQRFDAHRFYLRKRMKIASHHFSLAL